MAEPSPQLQHLLELGAKNMRLLAYMVAVAVFSAGIYSGLYQPKMIGLVPVIIGLAYGQSWLHHKLLATVPVQATAIVLMLDGLITGFGIAATHYALGSVAVSHW